LPPETYSASWTVQKVFLVMPDLHSCQKWCRFGSNHVHRIYWVHNICSITEKMCSTISGSASHW
jgi:hypothetical protein